MFALRQILPPALSEEQVRDHDDERRKSVGKGGRHAGEGRRRPGRVKRSARLQRPRRLEERSTVDKVGSRRQPGSGQACRREASAEAAASCAMVTGKRNFNLFL